MKLLPLLSAALIAAVPFSSAQGKDKMTAMTIQQTVLSAEGARIALTAAEKAAAAKGIKVSIAVMDANGHLLAFQRMDGAMLVSIAASQDKAHTAATLGAPSKAFQDLVDQGKPSILAVKGISPLQGGVPITINGVVVGGIGGSGASAEDDEIIARAGADAVAAAAARK